MLGTIFFHITVIRTFVLSISMALAFMFAVSCTLALVLSIGMTLTLVLTVGGTLALVLASSMALAFVLRSSCVGSMATGSAILATSGQFLAGRGIGLHGISIVTHFADFLAQYVGVCLFGIVIDRDFRRTGIIRVIFHTFEERNVLFETVNAFLAFEGSVGLDGNTLHLCVCTQCHYGHQGHQDKFFHFYCFINY